MLRFLGSQRLQDLGLKSITSQLERSLFCSSLVLLPLRGLICPAFCALLPPLHSPLLPALLWDYVRSGQTAPVCVRECGTFFVPSCR